MHQRYRLEQDTTIRAYQTAICESLSMISHDRTGMVSRVTALYDSRADASRAPLAWRWASRTE